MTRDTSEYLSHCRSCVTHLRSPVDGASVIFLLLLLVGVVLDMMCIL